MAQRRDPRPQLEILTVFGIHEPQLAQGIQAAAHRGAWDTGLLTDLRDRQQGPLRRERLNHLQTPRRGGHKVRIAFKRIAVAGQ